MRGQSALEMLVMVAFFAAFLIPFVLLFFTSANVASEDVAIAQAQKAAEQIADSADEVYFAGEGARGTVSVFFPPALAQIIIGGRSGREVTLVLQTAAGRSDAVAVSVANLTTRTDWTTRLGTGVRRLNFTRVNGNVSVDAYE
ncbi:MAG: hypothetical protein QXH27_00415 [Candidatus Micrarchaeia archaeon]